jgi:hypothetical protein
MNRQKRKSKNVKASQQPGKLASWVAENSSSARRVIFEVRLPTQESALTGGAE